MSFVTAGVAAGAGLVIGFYLPHGNSSGAAKDTFAPNAYLKITPDGKITIVVARSEMGQGVRTSLPMILAEELEADWKQITIEQAGASTLYGDQTTGGSASVRTTWDPMRKAGAAAREMLISAAALEWGVPRSGCKAENSAVVHAASNRRLTYGQLASKASAQPIPSDVPLKQAKDYQIVGKPVARLDTPSKVDGTAEFGIDFRVPGMKYAVLARCPVIGGKVASFDDKESKKISGVGYVGKIGDAAVAVVADSVWSAIEGRRMLNVQWDEGPNKDLNSAAIFESLKKSASDKAVTLYSTGDVSKASGRRIEAEYQLPLMAHAAMEPGNCTAHFRGSSCELWAPTQVPQDVRDSVAQAIGLDPDQVKVNVTLMGGGFGRRLEHDYGVEAALVSKAANAPVKVLWTREDDMRNSTYRPASYHKLSAVLDGQGWPVAFSHRIVAPSISGQKGLPTPNGVDPDLPDEAALIYSFPAAAVEYVMTETPVPLGWMRSVYALQAGFASESFIDELAAGREKRSVRIPAALAVERRRHQVLRYRLAYGADARRVAVGGGKGRVGKTAARRTLSRDCLLRLLQHVYGGSRGDHDGERSAARATRGGCDGLRPGGESEHPRTANQGWSDLRTDKRLARADHDRQRTRGAGQLRRLRAHSHE